MFNLPISGNVTAWETDQLMRMDAGRFKAYSGREGEPIAERKDRQLTRCATVFSGTSGL